MSNLMEWTKKNMDSLSIIIFCRQRALTYHSPFIIIVNGTTPWMRNIATILHKFPPQLNLLGHWLDFLVICTTIGDAPILIRPVVVVPSSVMTATDVGSGPH